MPVIELRRSCAFVHDLEELGGSGVGPAVSMAVFHVRTQRLLEREMLDRPTPDLGVLTEIAPAHLGDPGLHIRSSAQ